MGEKNLIKYVCAIAFVVKYWLASIATATLIIIHMCKRGLTQKCKWSFNDPDAYGCFTTV